MSPIGFILIAFVVASTAGTLLYQVKGRSPDIKKQVVWSGFIMNLVLLPVILWQFGLDLQLIAILTVVGGGFGAWRLSEAEWCQGCGNPLVARSLLGAWMLRNLKECPICKTPRQQTKE